MSPKPKPQPPVAADPKPAGTVYTLRLSREQADRLAQIGRKLSPIVELGPQDILRHLIDSFPL